MAASEPPLQHSPPTTLPIVLLSTPNTTDEPAIRVKSGASGGGVSDEVMSLLRQLDSKPSEGSGSSRSEQTHQPPEPSIDAVPNVDLPVDLHSMTFAQAIPRVVQLAQNQKVIEHLRKVRNSTVRLSRCSLFEQIKEEQNDLETRYWREREGIEKAQFTRVNQARTRCVFVPRVPATYRPRLPGRTSSAAWAKWKPM